MSALVFRPVRYSRGQQILIARKPKLTRKEYEQKLRDTAGLEPLHRRIRGGRRSADR